MRGLLEFMALVSPEPNTGCWIWLGSVKDHKGYGTFWTGERSEYAHRWALAHLCGPGDGYALHSCDNPACVNPDHLRWGDQRQNVADCVARGRRRTPDRGERSRWARLTAADVVAIRRRNASGEKGNRLAIEFRVSKAAVSAIVNRKVWRHLEG